MQLVAMGMITRWQISTRTLKHPERDGENGQARNMLLPEHIADYRQKRSRSRVQSHKDTSVFKYMSSGSPRQASFDLSSRKKPGNWPVSRMCPCDWQMKQCFVLKKHGASAAPLRG